MCSSATGWGSRRRLTVTVRWRSSRAGTWLVTGRRRIATWRDGRDSRCVTPAPLWARSRGSWASARMAWSSSPAPRGRPRRPLGAFDPLLLGWRSREELLALAGDRQIVTINGIFRPFALVDGRAVATWRLAGTKLEIEPFGALSRSDQRALETDAQDVLRYLGRG